MSARILQGANCFTMNNPMLIANEDPMIILNLYPMKNLVRLGEMLYVIMTKEFSGLRDLLNHLIQDIFYNSANYWPPLRCHYDSCQELRMTITNWRISCLSDIPQ